VRAGWNWLTILSGVGVGISGVQPSVSATTDFSIALRVGQVVVATAAKSESWAYSLLSGL
jgi:hypothetical protein